MSDLAAEIEAALQKHNRMNLTDARVRLLAGPITTVAVARVPPNARPASFRASGRATARKELDGLAECAERLVQRIGGLHQPAIIALANRGVTRHRAELLLLAFARAFRSADVSGVPEKVKSAGRPPNHQQCLVAHLIINAYEELSGGREDIPGKSQGLTTLIKEIFALTQLDGDPEAAKRAAAKQREERKKV